MPQLDRRDDVFVLDLGSDENRFHPDWLGAVDSALDEVEQASGHRALVTTATGKFFSNGLDLEWLMGHPGQLEPYLRRVHGVFARFLELPVPTVCAVQGHAFAAGAMLTLCHDARIMRADRGFWCLPEVSLGMAFTPGMTALIQARLTPQTAHLAMLTGQRFGGEEAQRRDIVDAAVPEEALLPTAVQTATALAPTAGATLRAIRTELYPEALRLLREGPAATSIPWG